MLIDGPQVMLGFIIIPLTIVGIITAFWGLLIYLNKDKKIKKNIQKLDLGNRIDITNEFMQVIDNVIDVEIKNRLAILAIFNTRYDVLHVDKDIDIIGKAVYAAVKEDIFVEKCLIFNPEYLLNYISAETAERFMLAVKQLNNSIVNIEANQ